MTGIPTPRSHARPAAEPRRVWRSSTQRQPGTTLLAADRQDRMAGALIGLHAGDALGSAVEFEPWAVIHERFPGGVRQLSGGGPFHWEPGQSTEDVNLTRAVLMAYLDLRANPTLDVVTRAAEHMLTWYDGGWSVRERGHPRDAAVATRVGLNQFRSSGDAYAAGAGAGHAGNGSLLRCLPCALARPHGPQRTSEAMHLSAITHRDPRCTLACAAYVDMVGALISGVTVQHAIERAEVAVLALTVGPAAPTEVLGAIHAARQLSLREIAVQGNTAAVGHGSGYVLNALKIAVAAALDERSFEEVLVDVVSIGGDTDTNAAVAGGLLGARDGLEAIPPHWVEPLEFRDEFLAAVVELSQE